MPDTLNKNILLCKCSKQNSVPKAISDSVQKKLSNSQCNLFVVDDLCGMCVNDAGITADLFKKDNLTIIACYNRVAISLAKNLDITLTGDIHNMKTTSPKTITGKLSLADGETMIKEYKTSNNDWQPWYPIIDRDRCNSCLQCKSFCLFNVYGTRDDGSIYVKSPNKCKTKCPACSRVCPQTAIIFPKHDTSPVNGDTVSVVNANKPNTARSITKGNIYDNLRNRQKGMTPQKLKTLKEELSIPQEVIDSLNPSASQPPANSCDCKNQNMGMCDSECTNDNEGSGDCNCNDNGGNCCG